MDLNRPEINDNYYFCYFQKHKPMADDIKDEIVLNDDELICVLTGDRKKANAKELMLQSVILQMNEEYGFEMSDMKRDYSYSYQDEEDKKKPLSDQAISDKLAEQGIQVARRTVAKYREKELRILPASQRKKLI